MRFLILGPLAVETDSAAAVSVTAPQVRKLLALMLLHRDRVLAAEHIADQLWPDRNAHQQSSALRFHMWKLRNALEPHRRDRDPGSLIATRPPGYVLSSEGHVVDAKLFEMGLAEARARSVTLPSKALSLLDEAFRLWRGAPLFDVRYEDFAQAEIRRLAELRFEAEVLRQDLLLRLGRYQQAAAELEALTVTYPLSEKMWGQLMTALYRDGRVGQALRAYDRARASFVGELGMEPPDPLQQLERCVRTGARDPIELERAR